MITTSIDCYVPGDNGLDNAVILRHAQDARDRETAAVVEATCPGCGGRARTEVAPCTIYRDGMRRVVTVLTCVTCKRVDARGRERPKTFEIEKEKETVMATRLTDEQKDARDRARSKIWAAVQKSGENLAALSRMAGIERANLDRWIKKGQGASLERLAPVLKWADDVIGDGEWTPVVDFEIEKEDVMAARLTDEDKATRDAARATINDAIRRSEMSLNEVATRTGTNRGNLHKWLTTGQGLSMAKAAPVIRWAEGVLSEEEVAVEDDDDVVYVAPDPSENFANLTEPMPGIKLHRILPAPWPAYLTETPAPANEDDKYRTMMASAPYKPGRITVHPPDASTPSPGDVILGGICERAAMAALREVDPDTATRVRARVVLEWVQ